MIGWHTCVRASVSWFRASLCAWHGWKRENVLHSWGEGKLGWEFVLYHTRTYAWCMNAQAVFLFFYRVFVCSYFVLGFYVFLCVFLLCWVWLRAQDGGGGGGGGEAGGEHLGDDGAVMDHVQTGVLLWLSMQMKLILSSLVNTLWIFFLMKRQTNWITFFRDIYDFWQAHEKYRIDGKAISNAWTVILLNPSIARRKEGIFDLEESQVIFASHLTSPCQH